MKNKKKGEQHESPVKVKRFWLLIGVILICAAVAFLVWPNRKSAKPSNQVVTTPAPLPDKNDQTRIERLTGRWIRNDGGYVLEIRSASSDGKMEAAYFNPNPIYVGRAEWQKKNNRIEVVVELRDTNYPGSTYTLTFLEKEEVMIGTYYQAVEGINYDVQFIREK